VFQVYFSVFLVKVKCFRVWLKGLDVLDGKRSYLV
jgi:hypothetical protein